MKTLTPREQAIKDMKNSNVQIKYLLQQKKVLQTTAIDLTTLINASIN